MLVSFTKINMENSNKKAEKGFVYVASDPKKSPSPYKFNADKKLLNLEFEHSVRTLKEHHPDIPVTLFTNYDELASNSPEVDNVLEVESDWGFLPKVSGLNFSPYKKTVFLDCDTQVNQPISELFDFLDEYDLAICQEFTNKNIFNTGVFAVNTSGPFLPLWLKRMHGRKKWAVERHSNGHLVPNKIPDDQAELNEIIRGLTRPRINKHIKEIQDTLKGFTYKTLDSRIYNCRVQELKSCKESGLDLNQIKVLHFRNLWRKK